jgi:hypothetical protein
MTHQNMNTNASAIKKKKDPTTDIAYEDPIESSSPTINGYFQCWLNLRDSSKNSLFRRTILF